MGEVTSANGVPPLASRSVPRYALLGEHSPQAFTIASLSTLCTLHGKAA